MHLSDYMKPLGHTDEHVAGAINRSRVTVSRIRRQIVRPDWQTIEEIKRCSGGLVTADDFAGPLVPVTRASKAQAEASQ